MLPIPTVRKSYVMRLKEYVSNVRCLFLKAVVHINYQADRELTEGKITTLRTCARLE